MIKELDTQSDQLFPVVPSRSGNVRSQSFPVTIGNGNVCRSSGPDVPHEIGNGCQVPNEGRPKPCTRVRHRAPYRRTWYTALLTAGRLWLRRGARHVSVDHETLEQTETRDPRKLPTVHIGDRWLITAGESIGIVEVVAMVEVESAEVRQLAGDAVPDGPVQLLLAGRPKMNATKRHARAGRDESMLPAVRAAREGTKP